MMEWIYKHRHKIHALALICNFGLGMFVGYRIVEHEAKTYVGTVIKKDYQLKSGINTGGKAYECDC